MSIERLAELNNRVDDVQAGIYERLLDEGRARKWREDLKYGVYVLDEDGRDVAGYGLEYVRDVRLLRAEFPDTVLDSDWRELTEALDALRDSLRELGVETREQAGAMQTALRHVRELEGRPWNC